MAKVSKAGEIAEALEEASHYREAMKRQQRYLAGPGRGEAEANTRHYERRAAECFDRATVLRTQDQDPISWGKSKRSMRAAANAATASFKGRRRA